MDKLREIVYARLREDGRNIPKKSEHDAFDREIERLRESAEERLERIYRRGARTTVRYKKRAIYSGGIVEYEIYPIWDHNATVSRVKREISKDSQKALNALNRKKRVIRLINTNFTDQDAWYTFSYGDKLPSYERAVRDVDNFIRRLKYSANKKGFELKYICIVEHVGKRLHAHIICNYRDRDTAEKMWRYGRTQGRRLQPDEFGLTALATYMVKECNGKKKYKASRNLEQPTVKETEITVRTARKAVKDYDSAAAEIRRLFKDYSISGIDLRDNPYCRGTYLYSILRRNT